MSKGLCVLVAMSCLTMMALAEPAGAAIRNIWFSNGSLPPGQITGIRSEGQLPGETKVFHIGKDKVARMFVTLGDFDAHTFRGELKGADGAVVRRLNWNLPSSASTATWRFSSYGFNLEGLMPGEYTIDLIVDDVPKGTYGFTLK